uniref:Major facilitator superfamily (MFS) profile domain-containing protein n=1 Tax=Ciona savignyi TaxID=51511 RepID=H2YWW5_CIOSA
MENWIECRFVLTALFFLGMMNMYMMRANLSVAMVVMVDSKQIALSKNHTLAACNGVDDEDANYRTRETFNWDGPTRGWILGAFYYGYMTTQIIGAFLEHKFGGKIVFGGAVALSSVLSLITPTMARLGPWHLMATRVLLGVSQGPMYPVHHGMWGKWAPPLSRSKLISITMTGTNIGTALSYNLSGYLARHGFAGGWPSVFYVMGIIGLCWVVLWVMFAFDSPAKHPRISERERRYIEQSIGTSYQKDMPKIPWKGIFMSPIFWGLFIGHFCSNYGHYNLLTNLPSYIDQVFGLSIKDVLTENCITYWRNGLRSNGHFALAAIPFISLWFFTTLAGWIADTVRESKRLSTLNVRRILIVIAQFVPAVFLVAAGYLGCNPAAAILVVTLAAGFGGFATPGFKVNVCHVEIAPRYSGILYSLTNTFATISGQVVGPIAGYVTGNITDVREAWRIVYYVGATVSALGGVVVLATLRTDVQPWAQIEEDFYE